MILSIRYISLILLLLFTFFCSQSINCQDLQENQSEDQIEKFAKYLYNLKLYDLAAEEYERLLYINQSNPEYLKYLIRSYRGASDDIKLKDRISKIDIQEPAIVKEYIYALLLESLNSEASELYNEHNQSFSDKVNNQLIFDQALANKDWELSKAQYNSLQLSNKMKYEPLMTQITQAKYKSPTRAAILSSILPGSGRIYAKDNIDGIISFVFVASTAYQAYRRFNKKGAKSVAGWLYGGVSLGFYISNIYGSYQSAKLFNNNIDKELHAKSLDIIRRN